MRAVSFTALASLTLIACGRPPSAYQHSRDQMLAMLPILGAIDDDLHPCYRTIDGKPDRLPNADCYRFGRPQRMRGIWWQGSDRVGDFYPNVTSDPGGGSSDFWLEIRQGRAPKDLEWAKPYKARMVLLDFIGRQTLVPNGGYGHTGMTKHLIVVDKVLHAEILN